MEAFGIAMDLIVDVTMEQVLGCSINVSRLRCLVGITMHVFLGRLIDAFIP